MQHSKAEKPGEQRKPREERKPWAAVRRDVLGFRE